MKILSTDIHNHLLPGVDDGFHKVEDSLKAIRLLSEAGCRDLVFTPHMNPELFPDTTEDKVRRVYSDFIGLIPPEWGMHTSLAGEYMIGADFEKTVAEKNGRLLCYPDKSILVEMSYLFRSGNLESSLFELQMAGYRPVLAHPERYAYMAQSLRDFALLRDKGCRFQLNYLSFTGAYGEMSLRIIRYLMRNDFCDFIATDLHSVNQLNMILSRNPRLLLRPGFAKLVGTLQ